MKLSVMKAVEEVLDEDPRTRESKYDWLLFYEVLRKLGYNLKGSWSWDMPHPESITRARRFLLNTKNKYPRTIELGPGVTIIGRNPLHT